MNDIPIRNGIYTITHEGQAQFYHSKSFGSLHDVLNLLHTARQAHDKVDKRRPNDNIPEADRLSMCSQALVPIVYYQPSLLLQPLGQEGFDLKMDDLRYGDEGTAHYAIDYDKDQFAMTSWDNDGLWTLKAPLSGIINAYGRSVRQHGRSRNFEEKVFLEVMETISSMERVEEGSFCLEQIKGADVQDQKNEITEGPADFAGPSM